MVGGGDRDGSWLLQQAPDEHLWLCALWFPLSWISSWLGEWTEAVAYRSISLEVKVPWFIAEVVSSHCLARQRYEREAREQEARDREAEAFRKSLEALNR